MKTFQEFLLIEDSVDEAIEPKLDNAMALSNAARDATTNTKKFNSAYQHKAAATAHGAAEVAWRKMPGAHAQKAAKWHNAEAHRHYNESKK